MSDGLITISKSDILKVFIFFIFIIIIRFIMIIMLKGLINTQKWKIDNKDIIILSYGGL